MAVGDLALAALPQANLEAALPEPSRLLDAALHRQFIGPVLMLGSGPIMNGGVPVPAYTRSLDAALGLIEAVLPAWSWDLRKTHMSCNIALGPDFDHPTGGEMLAQIWPGGPECEASPKLEMSFAPQDGALGLCACLMSVIEGIRAEARPRQDATALVDLNALAVDPEGYKTIEFHSVEDLMQERKNNVYLSYLL